LAQRQGREDPFYARAEDVRTIRPVSPRASSASAPAFALALLVVAAPGDGWAEDEGEISTDRPDFVESSEVVPHVQVETGFNSSLDKHGSVQTRTLTTPTLVRAALSRTFELRLETDGFTDAKTTDGASASAQGMADTSIGIKWHFQDGEEGGPPSAAWLADIEAPSGSAAFRGVGWRPSVRLVVEWTLPEEFSIGLMPGLKLDRTDDGHEFANGLLAVVVGNGFAPHWDAFVELAAQQIVARRYGGNIVTFDAGIAHRLTPDFQIDASLFIGLTDAAPAVQWGLGASFRF
jgi:hypothetical protein